MNYALTNKVCLNMKGQLITSSEHVKLLGVNIDNSLKCDTHVKELPFVFVAFFHTALSKLQQ